MASATFPVRSQDVGVLPSATLCRHPVAAHWLEWALLLLRQPCLFMALLLPHESHHQNRKRHESCNATRQKAERPPNTRQLHEKPEDRSADERVHGQKEDENPLCRWIVPRKRRCSSQWDPLGQHIASAGRSSHDAYPVVGVTETEQDVPLLIG